MEIQNTAFMQGLFHKFSKYVLAIVILLLTGSLLRNYLSLRRANNRLSEARIALEEVESRKNELASQQDQVQSQFFIEKQLRDNLGLAREDEIVLVLPDDDLLKRLSPRVEETEEFTLPDPNWKKWFNLFI